MKNILFKKLSKERVDYEKIIPSNYVLEVWKPRLFQLAPRNCSVRMFVVLYASFIWKILLGKDSYKIFIIRDIRDSSIKHYSFVIPKYWKYPFMKKNDFFIGPVWTDIVTRKQGIASCVLSEILARHSGKGDIYWLTSEENSASISLCKKFGFFEIGEARCYIFGYTCLIKQS
ncbi:MAG: GNAT family protein [Patescibacteria group bacterium]